MQLKNWIAFTTITLIVSVVLAACLTEIPSDQKSQYSSNSKVSTTMQTQGELRITLGQRGDDIVKQSGLRIKRSQVSTALLYDASPDRTGASPAVRFSIKNASVLIPHPANSILFYDDTEDPYGVEQASMSIKLPKAPKTGMSDQAAFEAYDRQVYGIVMDIVSRVNDAGWSRFVSPSEARLTGLMSYKKEFGAAADPRYLFTYEEWKDLAKKDLDISWHQSDALLVLTFMPGRGGGAIMDMIKIQISNGRTYLTAYDPKSSGDDKAGATELRKMLPELLKERFENEALAKAAGLTVQEDYVDPPLGGVEVPRSLRP